MERLYAGHRPRSRSRRATRASVCRWSRHEPRAARARSGLRRRCPRWSATGPACWPGARRVGPAAVAAPATDDGRWRRGRSARATTGSRRAPSVAVAAGRARAPHSRSTRADAAPWPTTGRRTRAGVDPAAPGRTELRHKPVLCPHYAPDVAPTGDGDDGDHRASSGRGHRLHIVTSLPWYRLHDVEPGRDGADRAGPRRPVGLDHPRPPVPHRQANIRPAGATASPGSPGSHVWPGTRRQPDVVMACRRRCPWACRVGWPRHYGGAVRVQHPGRVPRRGGGARRHHQPPGHRGRPPGSNGSSTAAAMR